MATSTHKPLTIDTSEVGERIRKALKSALFDFGCSYKEYSQFWATFPDRPQAIPGRLMVVASLASVARYYQVCAHHNWIASVRKRHPYFLVFVQSKSDERYADVVDDIFRHSDARITVCRGVVASEVRSCVSRILASFEPTTISAVRYVIPRGEFLVEFNDGFSGFLSPAQLQIAHLAQELVFESATVGSNGRTIELSRKNGGELFEIDSASARAVLDKTYHARLAQVAKRSNQQVGQLIRSARLAHRLSQVELASRAAIDQALISKLERGQHQPRFDTLERIAKAIGVSVSKLLTPG